MIGLIGKARTPHGMLLIMSGVFFYQYFKEGISLLIIDHDSQLNGHFSIQFQKAVFHL